MAYGVRCKHCGWQETNHALLSPMEDDDYPDKVYEGRTHSFNSCGGYEPEYPKDELAGVLANDGIESNLEYPLPDYVVARINKFAGEIVAV